MAVFDGLPNNSTGGLDGHLSPIGLRNCKAKNILGFKRSVVGPPLPTCAAHQSRQVSEVLRTCQASGQYGRCW
jgi:hypothetical protein